MKQRRYGKLTRGWDFRTYPKLLNQAEKRADELGLTKTQFIEYALKLAIDTPMEEGKMLASMFQSVSDLAKAILRISNRGENYDGQNSTHIEDWLAEGDYDGDETVAGLAAEWDE